MVDQGVATSTSKNYRSWTVAQAKIHLSKILRLSETEGPQQIGKHRRYVVVPASQWYEMIGPHEPAATEPGESLGQWLINNFPKGDDLNFEHDRKSNRDIPFNPDSPV